MRTDRRTSGTSDNIAILHDYFDKRGGGERLVINLARRLNADIYTGFVKKNNTFDLSGINVHSLGVRAMPAALRNIAISRRFKKHRFPRYDAYIFSGWWCISAVHNHPNLLYLHTPPRFIYDLKDYYMKSLSPAKRLMLKAVIRYWKPRDKRYMEQFDAICPNSENVRDRVMRYYGKRLYDKCRIVYTGIETEKFYWKKDDGFYLSTSRLDTLKRIDLIIEAFKKNGRELIIAGSGSDEQRLKKLAHGCGNIKFTGQISESELLGLYARCKATVFAAKDEDLGLSPIESNAAGKPAICAAEGGPLETVADGKTGLFFKPDIKSLIDAIGKSEKIRWNHKEIKKNAKRFDIDVFAKAMKGIVRDVIGEHTG